MRGFRVAFLGLTAGAALALAATGASAGGYGDRGSVKDGPYAAPFSWTGFYLGGAIGYGIGTSEIEDELDLSLRGAQGIVSAGYDFRVGSGVILGVFTDYAFGDVDGDVDGANFSIDNQWAIGARLGFAASPSTLWYGTVGWTRADFEISVPGDSEEETVDGFFVGAGIEQALTRNLSLKAEYRFSDYETAFEDTFDNTVHSIRVGVNWRFGGRDEHRAPLK